MNKEFRLGQIYMLTLMVISLIGLVVWLAVMVRGLFSGATSIEQAPTISNVGWIFAMLFGLRARRFWAFALNQTLLGVGSILFFLGGLLWASPLFLICGIAAVAFFTYFWRYKHLFPVRVAVPASQALKEYQVSDREKRVRRQWFTAAILMSIVLILHTALVIPENDAFSLVTLRAIRIGSAIALIFWRLWVTRCAHTHWGTRMSLWEILTTCGSLALLTAYFIQFVLPFSLSGVWTPLLAWIVAAAITLFYLISTYRLRQQNLRFRTHREALTSSIIVEAPSP